MPSAADLIGLGMPAALANRLGYTTRADTPASVVTPQFVGQVILDTVGKVFYAAAGATSSDWKALNS